MTCFRSVRPEHPCFHAAHLSTTPGEIGDGLWRWTSWAC